MPREDETRYLEALIVAPLGRDAESIRQLLVQRGHPARVCVDMVDLTGRIGPSTGLVILTEETLVRGTPQTLFEKLRSQPAWSDLPFIYLRAPSRQIGRPLTAGSALPRGLGNGMVLERPLGTQSLLSAIEWALASRRRQHQIRDQVEQLQEQTRMLSEAAQRISESESRFRAITDSMPQIVWSARADGFHDYVNRRYLEFTGRTQMPGTRSSQHPVVHPDDKAIARAAWERALATGTDYTVEYRMRHRSGAYRWHLAQAVPVHEGDRAVRWFGTCTDIDDQVRAREALAQFNERLEREVEDRTHALNESMTERERVEGELRQAQKMEAIGQLTGGLAHDFNNFLTGVIGSLDIVKRRLKSGRTDDIARFMDVASSSAQRAATLTHRLLTFSRQQTLAARPIDLNDVVDSMQELLLRSVDERIVLHQDLQAALPHAIADANQVESALLNLVINARDAMPDGGTLTISTRLVEVASGDAAGVLPAGRYVELAVTDTGVGMSAAVLSRAVEPFFTTKPIGKGTGLGLSTIYGFARQSNGELSIESLEGRGTTIRLRLPAAVDVPDVVVDAKKTELARGIGERILVVEDDPAVRTLVVTVLDELGYEALEADDARAALEVLGTEKRIDLMISDVGLPGMNGRQLADIARVNRPGLRILFMTGYAGTERVRLSGLEDGMSVMTKPFPIHVLAEKIQALMR